MIHALNNYCAHICFGASNPIFSQSFARFSSRMGYHSIRIIQYLGYFAKELNSQLLLLIQVLMQVQM